MPDILVLGAGVNGLTLAMLLAGDGHRVTVLERDGADPGGREADELWHGWLRRGVSQFRQPHFLLPRWRAVMADELPAVLDEMVAMGALRANLLAMMPERMRGPLREGDESHELVTARRPVLEGALARVASATPGVRIRRGVAVTGLVTGPEAIAGVPHVAGVLTGLSSFVASASFGRRENPLSKFPRVIMAATAALLVAQPLGLLVQEKVTTCPDASRLSLGPIKRTERGNLVIHFVTVNG